MTFTAAQLDALPAREAALKLADCCGSTAWVAGMLAHRPFCTRENALAVSEEIARELTRNDWLEAFAHHPRIGELNAAAGASPIATGWASSEQVASSIASAEVQAALADANAAYDTRFGFIFIICANGRSGEDILAALRARMGNERDAEIDNAAREQRRITRLRLEKLISNGERT